jgi:hypothetical protein
MSSGDRRSQLLETVRKRSPSVGVRHRKGADIGKGELRGICSVSCGAMPRAGRMMVSRFLIAAVRRLVAVTFEVTRNGPLGWHTINVDRGHRRFTRDRADGEGKGGQQKERALNHGALASSMYRSGEVAITTMPAVGLAWHFAKR